MSLTPREIATEIVAREGGFVNHPDDPGGATKHGVTIHTLRRLGLDLTGDGAVDVADVRALTPRHAVDIFLRHYYEDPRIDALPGPLRATVFDMQVNAGAHAVRILQRLLRSMGHQVAVDGVIGPQTLRAAQAAHDFAGADLVNAYGIARRNYYLTIADRNPRLRTFARRRDGGKGGWITRAEEFIDPRDHLSQAEFQRRVSAWG